MKQKIKCKFQMFMREIFVDSYTCVVAKSQTFLENTELEFVGNHLDGKSNFDVDALFIKDCSTSTIPQNLTKIFPNMTNLSINNSKLKHIKREDFKDYSKVTHLYFYDNEIEFLPGDLFADMKQLDSIAFRKNKIRVIEPGLLDGLTNLKHVYLNVNPCINRYFNSYGKISTIEEIKQEIRDKFSKNNLKHDGGFMDDLKCIIQTEDMKDLTIIVDNEEFKVHKLVLAARSPTILEMIESNVDAVSLNLDNISVEIFRMILNYMYTDKLPESNADFINLFIASDKLKIGMLKDFCAEKLIEKINAENTFDMLTLANKYDHEKLRRKSFKLIKNTIGEEKIDSYLAKQPDLLKTLMQLEKEQDKMDESDEFEFY